MTEATYWDAEHWRKDPISQKAIAEITRLQSELNTALERVKVLDGKLSFAVGELSQPHCSHRQLCDWLSAARAVLQSSGGKQ